MRNIICFHGNSGAGKTTLAHALAQTIDSPVLTPTAKWKRFLESVYNLQEMTLDTQEGKNKRVSENTTFGELLVDSFHFWADHDPGFGARCLSRDLKDVAFSRSTVIVESIRNPEEVKVINEAAVLHDAAVFVFLLDREEAEQCTSDKQQQECVQCYKPGTLRFEIDNNDNLPSVFAEVFYHYRKKAKQPEATPEFIEQQRTTDL